MCINIFTGMDQYKAIKCYLHYHYRSYKHGAAQTFFLNLSTG